jgi:phosphoenolpyruvate-protein kinase (PTS system EI component)
VGRDEFSAVPAFIPHLKKCIRETNFAAAKEVAGQVARCTTSREVEDILAKNGGVACREKQA